MAGAHVMADMYARSLLTTRKHATSTFSFFTDQSIRIQLDTASMSYEETSLPGVGLTASSIIETIIFYRWVEPRIFRVMRISAK